MYIENYLYVAEFVLCYSLHRRRIRAPSVTLTVSLSTATIIMSRAMAIGAGTKGSARSGTNASGMLALAGNLATQSSIALSLAEACAADRSSRGWKRSRRREGERRRRGGRRWTTCDGLARAALTTALIAIGGHLSIACREARIVTSI